MKMMKIDPAVKMLFSELRQGEPFIDEYGHAFMKITPTCDAEDADNAVNLEVGYGCKFGDGEIVKHADVRVLVFSR